MRKIAIIICLLAATRAAAAEDSIEKQNQAIVAEGKRLYQSEMASWYGTDVFIELSGNMANMGGYFSYVSKDRAVCVFYDNGATPGVISTISFDSSYSKTSVRSDFSRRAFTREESELYALRVAAMAAVADDTFFKFYEHTNYNYIPLLDGKQKKVYIITGTSMEGLAIFGNDYLLTFDRNNVLRKKTRLHQGIISIEYGTRQKSGSKARGAVHNHLPGTSDLMTPTDVCTLMLYEKLADWEQHIVLSGRYVSIWNCITNEVHTITTDKAGDLIQLQD